MNHISVCALAFVALATLAGCQSSQPMQVSAPMSSTTPEEPLRWIRTDGQRGSANPALADQFTTDSAYCSVPPVSAATNAALRLVEPCMASRGYALVPASQAAAALEQYRRQAGY
jgi:hypothetical protein